MKIIFDSRSIAGHVANLIVNLICVNIIVHLHSPGCNFPAIDVVTAIISKAKST